MSVRPHFSKRMFEDMQRDITKKKAEKSETVSTPLVDKLAEVAAARKERTRGR